MKAIACLVALTLAVGYTVASGNGHNWETNKEYIYKFYGRQVAGIPGISNQFATASTLYTLLVEPEGESAVKLQIKDFQVITSNKELKGDWRALYYSPKGKQETVKEQVKRILESPFKFNFENGIVTSMVVSADTPTWARNIFRGIAFSFGLNTARADVVVEGGNTFRPDAQTELSSFFFKILEENIYGKCINYYTIAEQERLELFPADRKPVLQSRQPTESEESSGKQNHKTHGHRRTRNGQRGHLQARNSQESSSSSSEEQDTKKKTDDQIMNDMRAKICKKDEKLYIVMQSVNFTQCDKKAVLAYITPNVLNGRAGDNNVGSYMSRVVTAKTYGCGKTHQDITIIGVKVLEEHNFGQRVLQKTVAGTKLKMFLVEVNDKPQNKVAIREATTDSSLMYQWNPISQKLQRQGLLPSGFSSHPQQARGARRYTEASLESSEVTNVHNSQHRQVQSIFSSSTNDDFLPPPPMDYPPLNPFLASPVDSKEKLIQRYVQLLSAAINDLNPAHSGRADREIIGKLSTSARVLRHLPFDAFPEVYKKVVEDLSKDAPIIATSMFFDTLVISGVNPAIKFFLLKIKDGTLAGEAAIQRIKMLALYVRTPTPELLRFIQEILVNRVDANDIITERDQLKTAIVLAWSNLLRQSCVNPETKETRYPTSQYGEWCTDQIFRAEFFPYFVKLVDTHVKSFEDPKNKHGIILALRALGNTGHPLVIETLKRVIQTVDDVYIQSQAVLALDRVVKLRKPDMVASNKQFLPVDRRIPDALTFEVIKTKVLPLLVSIAFDRTQPYEIRLPAIALLFRCSATDRTIMQQLARLTVYDSSFQVRAFIFLTLNNLANLQSPTTNRLWYLRRAARSVVALTSPVNGRVLGSNNIYFAEFNRFSEVAQHLHLMKFASRDSWMPFRYVLETYISTGNGGTALHPLKLSLQGRSLHALFSELYQTLPWVDKPCIDKKTTDLLNIIATSQLVTGRVQDKDMVANLLVTIEGQIQRLFSVNLDNLNHSKIIDILDMLRETLKNINFHQVAHLSEYDIEIPSVVGIPLSVKYTKAAIVSIRGRAQAHYPDLKEWYKNIQLQAEFNTFVSVRSMERVGFKVPYIGKTISTGIERHFAAEPQFRILARHTPNNRFEIAVTPAQLNEEQTSSRIVIASFHQKPYTLVSEDSLLPPLDDKNTDLLYVRTVPEQKRRPTERRVGEAIGFPIIYREDAEFTDFDERQSHWFERWVKRIFSPSQMVSNQDVSAPSNRYFSQKIILDVFTSVSQASRTFVLEIVPTKTSESSMVPTHLRSQLQSSEESSSSSESNEHNGSKKKSSSSSSSSSSEEMIDKHQEVRFVWAIFGIGRIIPKLSTVEGRFVDPLTLGPVTTMMVMNFKAVSQNMKFTIALNEAAKKFAQKDNLPQVAAVKPIKEALEKYNDSKDRPNMCIRFEGDLKTPEHIKRTDQLTLRALLLKSSTLSASLNAKLEYGQDCSTLTDKTVKLQGTMKRTRGMYEWAKEESRRAKNCNRDEKRDFYVSDDCILNAREEAAALNEISLKLTSSKPFSRTYLNVTDRLMGMIFGEYHPYSTWETHSQEGKQNQASLLFTMLPTKEFFDLEFMVENSKLTLDRVRTNRLIKRIFPLTATKNIFRNIHDRTLNYYAKPTCSLQKRYFNTFDNKTMSFDPEAVEGCYTVLTQDCSNKYQMAVLVKNLNTQILEFLVIVNGNKIRIVTERVGTAYKVKINGQEISQQQLQSGKIFYNPGCKTPLGHIELSSTKQVQLIVYQTLTLVTDGRYVTLSLDNKFRNRVCGMCGNMDMDDSNELIGPTTCPLSSPNVLYRAYGVPHSIVDGPRVLGATCIVPSAWKDDVEKPFYRDEEPCGRERVCSEIVKAAVKLIGERFRAAIQPCLWLDYAQHSKNDWVERVKEHARKVLASMDCNKMAEDANKIAQEIFDKASKESWWPTCIKVDIKVIIEMCLEAFKVKP